MSFTIEKKLQGTLGRAGRLTTEHGVIQTPAFATVGTKATVKALTPVQIAEAGAEVVLANTYHLYLEPGEGLIEEGGGLGRFMGWKGPTMTDSGGFQVFSLGVAFGKKISKVNGVLPPPLSKGRIEEGWKESATTPDPSLEKEGRGKLVSIDEDGVTFKSYKDGSEHRFTPERSIEIQHAIGADIIFAFDECTSPTATKEYQREAMERTHRWAGRCLARHRELQNTTTPSDSEVGDPSSTEEGVKRGQQMLFGIVQGGRYEDLRKESARVIGGMKLARTDGSRGGFDGFGIGGSFDKEDMGNAVRWVNELLPEEKPRHLLGIGDPVDLFDAVENGCDLFDCVAPTRQARTGSLYTQHGRFNIENAQYRNDFAPIEGGCGCYTCLHFTKAYLAHLFRSGEILANTLASIHNVYFIVQLVKKMRQWILEETFLEHKKQFLASYKK